MKSSIKTMSETRAEKEKMDQLPFPREKDSIRKLLETIDDKLLFCSERFIRLQVKKPVEILRSGKVAVFDSTKPQHEWFNIYSVYSANQQLNEACNKLWATVELANATSKKVWKKKYHPIGENFSGIFLLGTLIPTLHYAQLSAMISILSAFGCIPIALDKKPYFLIRTEEGWRIFHRQEYLADVLGVSSRGWHEQIINTYDKLAKKGIGLPSLNIKRISKLKDLRNRMHYEILGDLRMSRAFKSRTAYSKNLPFVINTVETAAKTLAKIKKITSGCDGRLGNLKSNLSKVELG
jgi:hypothetical protein